MNETSPLPPTLWLRARSRRIVVRRHLHHVAGSFRAAGWHVHAGTEPPHLDGAPLAVLDDPWLEVLPELARGLLDAVPDRSCPQPAWRLPRIHGLPGRQGWRPRFGPFTLSGYRRSVTRSSRRWRATRLEEGPWTGFAVASGPEAAELLERGWPPGPEQVALVPRAHLYRYADPADHERRELDPYVPPEARLVVDVGCGHGRLGERLRRPGRWVIGLEPDREMASSAARRLDLVLPSPAKLGLAALAVPVDCLVFADVLEHLEDPAAVLGLAAEHLAPDGVIVASVPNTAWAPVLRELAAGHWESALAGVQARDHLACFTPDSFARMATECGLAVHQRVPLAAPLPLALRLWAWLAARTGGGDPHRLAGPQWVFVLGHGKTR